MPVALGLERTKAKERGIGKKFQAEERRKNLCEILRIEKLGCPRGNFISEEITRQSH